MATALEVMTCDRHAAGEDNLSLAFVDVTSSLTPSESFPYKPSAQCAPQPLLDDLLGAEEDIEELVAEEMKAYLAENQ